MLTKWELLNKQRTVNYDYPYPVTDPPTHGSLFIYVVVLTSYSMRLESVGKRPKNAILRKTPSWERKKQESTTWLEQQRVEIESGELVVLFLDECHLLWGDVTGYVWGKTNQRIEVPVVNQRQRQTYAWSFELPHTRVFG